MTPNRLQEDLLLDFRAQKQILNEQIALFDPLATSLRKPAAQRLASNTGLVLAEIICYLLAVGFLALTFGMNLVYPFSILAHYPLEGDVQNGTPLTRVEWFNISMHALAAIISILFYIVARLTRRIRLKNAILHVAGTNIKTLVGQHLKRKATMEGLEQRHFQELPTVSDLDDENVYTMPNPGY